MSAPDIVYIVRPGDDNRELRYSLRSLDNVPHGRVWIAGYVPSWVQNVEPIPLDQKPRGRKWLNALDNLRAALEVVPEDFVLFNDDFYILEELERVEVYHRGPMRALIPSVQRRSTSEYVRARARTYELLLELGHPDPLDYSLHVPLPVSRSGLLETLELTDPHNSDGRLHLRSLYGNLRSIGGERLSDVKVRAGAPNVRAGVPYLSTNDQTVSSVRRLLRRHFPNRSRYERML